MDPHQSAMGPQYRGDVPSDMHHSTANAAPAGYVASANAPGTLPSNPQQNPQQTASISSALHKAQEAAVEFGQAVKEQATRVYNDDLKPKFERIYNNLGQQVSEADQQVSSAVGRGAHGVADKASAVSATMHERAAEKDIHGPGDTAGSTQVPMSTHIGTGMPQAPGNTNQS
eukprot:jgi/Chrzof1/2236/Cz11g07220.t1